MTTRASALLLLAALGGCAARPTVVASEHSPDGRLIARLFDGGTGATAHHLTLDIGVADAGPFTTLAILADRAEPFPLRWRGPSDLEARLPCAATSLRGQLQQRIMLPDKTTPVTIRLTRPAACKLPLVRMR